MQAVLPENNRIIRQNGDRRRDQREPRSTVASVVTVGRPAVEALLTDISIYGCCIETSIDWLRPGRCVSIGLAGGLKLESIVRWTGNDLAGLELLHPAAADQLEWLALID